MEAVWPYLLKLQMYLPFDQAIPIQWLYLIETPLYLTYVRGYYDNLLSKSERLETTQFPHQRDTDTGAEGHDHKT